MVTHNMRCTYDNDYRIFTGYLFAKINYRSYLTLCLSSASSDIYCPISQIYYFLGMLYDYYFYYFYSTSCEHQLEHYFIFILTFLTWCVKLK